MDKLNTLCFIVVTWIASFSSLQAEELKTKMGLTFIESLPDNTSLTATDVSNTSQFPSSESQEDTSSPQTNNQINDTSQFPSFESLEGPSSPQTNNQINDTFQLDSCEKPFEYLPILTCCDTAQPCCSGDDTSHNYEELYDSPSYHPFFLRADLLYWTPRVSGIELDFGTTYIEDSTVGGVQRINAKELDLDPHFKWNAGYRVGAGYAFDCSNWEVGVLWTHFNGRGQRDKHEDADTLNRGRIKMKFNQLDIVAAYNFNNCFCCDLKPFIGVRAVKFHESVNSLLVTNVTILPATLASQTKSFHDNENYTSVGPVFGLEAICDIGCGYGIYGTIGASALYGYHKLRFNDVDTFTAPFNKVVTNHNRRHLHDFVYNIDLALGISWSKDFCNGFKLLARLGFEHHQYFNLSHISVNRGDFSLNGGVFSLGLGY